MPFSLFPLPFPRGGTPQKRPETVPKTPYTDHRRHKMLRLPRKRHELAPRHNDSAPFPSPFPLPCATVQVASTFPQAFSERVPKLSE